MNDKRDRERKLEENWMENQRRVKLINKTLIASRQSEKKGSKKIGETRGCLAGRRREERRREGNGHKEGKPLKK